MKLYRTKGLKGFHMPPSRTAKHLDEYGGQYERVTECKKCDSLYAYWDLHPYTSEPCVVCGGLNKRLRIGQWVPETVRVPWVWKLTKKVKTGYWKLEPL